MATTTHTPITLQDRLAAAQAAFNALPENGAGDVYSDLLDDIASLSLARYRQEAQDPAASRLSVPC